MIENNDHSRTPRLWQTALVSTLVGLLAAPEALMAAPQERTVFPREQFKRTGSSANDYSRDFEVPAYVRGPFTLDVVNGEDGRSVKAGTLSVDGRTVADTNDLRRGERFQKSLTLAPGSHELKVRLTGRPG